MKKVSVIKWLRNVSIAKKLYFTVGIMAMLIAMELMTLLFAINTLSAVRTYVGAEGLWSKAQKDAVYYLQKYGNSRNKKDYDTYLSFLKVNLGDRKTRLELLKAEPDMSIARDGFLEGRLHPDDIDGAIKLVRRFHSISYIARAIALWTKGDLMISELQAIGDELHNEITSASPSQDNVTTILKKIDPLNEEMTELEDDFSFTLGEGSRWLAGLILTLLFSLVLTVEISGLSLTIFVSRGIAKGLNEIIRSAKKIATGDFSIRARAFSEDEIGILAHSFNNMTDKLEQNINALKHSDEKIRKAETERSKIITDIVQRNKNLEQFSYIISHNLRSPVANILGITEVLQFAELESDEKEELMVALAVSTRKLDEVIRDLNAILHVKNEMSEKKETVRFSGILEDIKISIESEIKHKNIEIKSDFGAVDEMQAFKSYIYSIFFNLISNSIKYRRPDISLHIELSSARLPDAIELTFKDNGLGIDLTRNNGQLFGLYKRFHTHVEGKGMGLFMVKTQVEALGGEITLSSEVNKGTEFRIRFGLPA